MRTSHDMELRTWPRPTRQARKKYIAAGKITLRTKLPQSSPAAGS